MTSSFEKKWSKCKNEYLKRIKNCFRWNVQDILAKQHQFLFDVQRATLQKRKFFMKVNNRARIALKRIDFP